MPLTSRWTLLFAAWTAVIVVACQLVWNPFTKLLATLSSTGTTWLQGLLYLPGLLFARAPAIAWVFVVLYAQWAIGTWLDAWLRGRHRDLDLGHVERVVVGQAVTALMVFVLGMAGWLRPAILVPLPLLVATARLTLGDAALLLARARALRSWRPRTTSSTALTTTIIAAALAVAALATAHPVWLYDVLAYDFGTPQTWLLEGGFLLNPHDVRAFAFAQAESQFVVAMAGAGLHGAQWLTLVTFVLLLVWVGEARSLPGDKRIARLLLATTPVLLLTAANGKPDVFYILYAAVAVDRALVAADLGSPRDLWVAGLATGMCTATKATAVPVLVAPLLVVVIALWMARRHRHLGLALATAALGGLLPLLPWMARNAAWTGNPIYPLLTNLLGGPVWSADLLAADMHRRSIWSLDLLDAVRTTWELTFAPYGTLLDRFGVFAVLGPAWLWLVPATFRRDRRVIAGFALVVLSAVAFLSTAWILRFAIVTLPIGALLAGQLTLSNRPHWLRALVLVGALVTLTANGTYVLREVLARTAGLALATTDMSDHGFLMAMSSRRPIELGTYPLAHALGVEHPDARVMIVGDTVHSYLGVRHTHASPFNAPAIQPYLSTDGGARALAADGYTHLLFNPRELDRIAALGAEPRLSEVERARLDTLVRTLPCRLGDCSLSEPAVLEIAPSRSPNIVLISIDTLRNDHLGCNGYQRDTSPTLDRLAREGTHFTNVSSTTSWTLPAHAALFTGLFDPLHGATWDQLPLDPSRITLAELLAAGGYQTAAVFTAPYLLPQFGLDQGFGEYHDATRYDKTLTGPDVLVASEKGRTTDGALQWVDEWLGRRDPRPFFLFVHLFDVHPDFDPPPPFDTMFDVDYAGTITGSDVFHNPAIHADMDERDLAHLVALYDGEIRYVDEHGISRLLALLEREAVLNDTVLAITADHGEEFFEHGRFGHRHNLHRETTRVPLILWGPGVPDGRDVETFVRTIDIVPTLLELADQPAATETLGTSLMPLARGAAEAEPREAFLLLKGGVLHLEGLETGTEKTLVDHGTQQFTHFDLNVDPLETSSLPADDRARQRFNAFRRALAEVRARLPRTGTASPLDDVTRQRLQSLGYVEENP